jgi:hypothetical protein
VLVYDNCILKIRKARKKSGGKTPTYIRAGTPVNTKGSNMKKLLIALLIGAFSIVPLILVGCGDQAKEETAADTTTTTETVTPEVTPEVTEGTTEEVAPTTETAPTEETGTVAEPTTETTEKPVTQ